MWEYYVRLREWPRCAFRKQMWWALIHERVTVQAGEVCLHKEVKKWAWSTTVVNARAVLPQADVAVSAEPFLSKLTAGPTHSRGLD